MRGLDAFALQCLIAEFTLHSCPWEINMTLFYSYLLLLWFNKCRVNSVNYHLYYLSILMYLSACLTLYLYHSHVKQITLVDGMYSPSVLDLDSNASPCWNKSLLYSLSLWKLISFAAVELLSTCLLWSKPSFKLNSNDQLPQRVFV